MRKRVCPVCDQAMKGKHYCSFCKNWVRHPYVMEINYFLNERHPAGERSCEYHIPAAAGSAGREAIGQAAKRRYGAPSTATAGKKNSNTFEIPKTLAWPSAAKGNGKAYGSGAGDKKDSKGANLIAAVIFIIVLFLKFLDWLF